MVRNYCKRNEPRPRGHAALVTLEASIIAGFLVAACGGGDHDQSAVPDHADGAAGGASLSPDAGSPPSQPIDDHIRRIIEEDGAPVLALDGGADADAELRGVGGQDPEEDAGLLIPTVDVCNDGTRGASEECDDGNVDVTDACLFTCRVRDMRVLEDLPPPDSELPTRTLGEGRHPVAVGASGFAVAFIETFANATTPELDPMVVLAHFGSAGTRGVSQRTNISSGTTPTLFADPVVAALPSGAYAVAWNDFDGDGDALGVALRRVVPGGASPTLSSVQYANASTLYSQSEPDMLWTGTELIVGWVDDTDLATGPDIRYRRFDQNLTPLDSADQPLAATVAVEDGLAFAPFKNGWAAAWRENSLASSGETDGMERIVVTHQGITWETDPFWPGPADDKPSMAELDGSHLLLVFSAGTDPWGDFIFDIPRIHGAILDTDSPGTVTIFPIDPSTEGAELRLDQSHPNVIRISGTTTRFFAAFRKELNVHDDLLLKELFWNGTTETLDVTAVPIALPRLAESLLGDQRLPALAASTVVTQGAIVAAWDDLYAELDPGAVQAQHDVRVELIPLPIVRNP